jgi:acyl dehydratase
MTINRDYIGRTFPPGEPYEVSRVKIAEFASAIGDPSPVYRDRGAAKAAGHPDVIAPPTFAIVFNTATLEQVARDSELGINRAKVVHGEQRFEYTRPIGVGDVLTATSTISDIREAGGNVVISLKTDITAASGERVCTAHSTLVERG